MIPSMCNFLKTVKKIIFTAVILLLSSKCLLAQYNIDSIKALTYEEFEKYFEKSYADSVKDLIYANAFLEKAKKEADIIKTADAYYQLSIVYEHQTGLQYADSCVIITKKLKGNKLYPALGYISKGGIYYSLGELQMAIDQYVIAHQLAEKNKNNVQLAAIKLNIGLIKNNLGEKEEALRIFKDNINFVTDSKIPNKNLWMANGLLALADAYTNIQEYDSASIAIENGIKVALQENYIDYYAEFLNLCGINFFHTHRFQSSIDSIQKAIKVHDLQNNISFAYLYLGKSKLALGDTVNALNYFFKVDSFLCSTNLVTQELLEAYMPVIEYYRKRKDYARQLFYTNQLIKFDSVFNTTRTIVTKDIAKKYDIPLLLASKEELIDKLNKDMTLSAMNNYLLLIFSFLLMAIAAYLLLRNRRNKKRFKKVLSLLKEKEANRSLENEKQVVEENKTENTRTEIDDELVGSILNKLDKFEQSQRFTNSYTLIKLARELKTNYTYLSKIINEHKGLSFSNYLNNLRIDLAMSRLKNDPKFRTYTIQAIAEEVGFNKAQSFSVAFHKRTGMKPSYFIKQIGKTGS